MSFSFALHNERNVNEPDVIVNFMGRRNCFPGDQDAAFANYHVEQYAVGVLDFSSQYGIDYSISYTAPNIIGRPIKFPSYGDYPETFAMRTYGNWWHQAPSGTTEIQRQNMPAVAADDFIVLYFEDYIIPNEVAIYETFNPGAVIRIWAYTIAKTWICLWEAKDFYTRSPFTPQLSRRFAPPIKKITLPVKTIRLEFNHNHLNYYTEIDAVLLAGESVNVRHMQYLMQEYWEKKRKNALLRKLYGMEFRPRRDNYETQMCNFLKNELNTFMIKPKSECNDTSGGEVDGNPTSTGGADANDATGSQQDSRNDTANGQDSNKDTGNNKDPCTTTAIATPKQGSYTSDIELADLPFEILLKIFGYLDLESLFTVGLVSRTFYEISNHPLLYCELNLKPYWHLANSELLCILARRATMLRKLDLSWCGLFNTISPTEFKKFITQRGDNLTHLRLNSCKFLNGTCIETLGIVCDNLIELSLRNCTTEPPIVNFSCLANLKNLERLDLFQTAFESELLLVMLEGNQKLKHLNLAFCGVNVNMDNVAAHIGNYNKELISLDMWKSHSLSARGLTCLAKCTKLEELDIGWCLREAPLGDSLYILLSSCPNLRKLFLSTVRGITERDISHIANLCQNLEQLDLMGILSLTLDRVEELLTKCRKLKLLDVSFCDNILEQDMHNLLTWSRIFDVQIKCSHVPYYSR